MVVMSWVNFGTLGLLFAMMFIVGQLRKTGLFEVICASCLRTSKGNMLVVSVLLCCITAFISFWSVLSLKGGDMCKCNTRRETGVNSLLSSMNNDNILRLGHRSTHNCLSSLPRPTSLPLNPPQAGQRHHHAPDGSDDHEHLQGCGEEPSAPAHGSGNLPAGA